MYRVMWLLKRKAGISHEQFREHYETSHAELGKRYIGHLMLGYHRNYDAAKVRDAAFETPMSVVTDYDCVAEWVMHDEAAFDEAMRIMAEPDILKIFLEDETHFLDSASTRLLRCDTGDTGTGS
ncbi:MAG: EthD domain-containing protein [Novosphingobium sp.]|nr:EthD domain-containing protein [Novosphingobium sp.]